MARAQRATARLQAQWDLQVGTKCVIRKGYAKPKSHGSAGLTWLATTADGTIHDLGYTELKASWMIRNWNEPMLVAGRKMSKAMDDTLRAVAALGKAIQQIK